MSPIPVVMVGTNHFVTHLIQDKTISIASQQVGKSWISRSPTTFI